MNDRISDVLPWLTLQSVPGVGNLLFKRLIDRFGAPGKVLDSSANDLVQVEGISKGLARAILNQKEPKQARKDIAHLQNAGCTALTQNDPLYPALLLEVPDPPPILYVYGKAKPYLQTVAVVGARKATRYGRAAAQELCKELANHGITVVSGMALGIDTAAHQGALAGGGSTVAVLGSGLGNIYPRQNLNLSRKIAEKGCVMTEFAWNARPESHHFPMRNRIISGMSLGTVVVEAARRSGSLITARLAAEQNREVFAVPGSIHAQTTRGTHDLIKQGAKLVEDVRDILEEILPQLVEEKPDFPRNAARNPLPSLTDEEEQVLSLIGPYPVHIDQLARDQGMAVGRIVATLSLLELKGIVCQEPGNLFLRHPDYMKDGRENTR